MKTFFDDLEGWKKEWKGMPEFNQKNLEPKRTILVHFETDEDVEKFAPRKYSMPPFILNTRIYSCILIKNDIPFRWRGRYNEDTDLSLNVLKNGWCTVLFNAFLCGKQTTMTMKGGNTDELYKDDGRLKMAKSLEEQHPDITKVVWKWGRYQHSVDYSRFKNVYKTQLIRKKGYNYFGINNYGMKLIN